MRLRFTSINEDNLAEVYALFPGFADSEEMLQAIAENYLPAYANGQRTKYGFNARLGEEWAGLSLLGVDSFKERKGYTGADTLPHMRGKAVAPPSKPHLFYLACELLNLHRVETGCLVANLASKRSIEKTAGFQFEGTRRESGRNERGEWEDEYLYAVLRRDWRQLYDKAQVRVIV